jgi:hypothetical protein
MTLTAGVYCQVLLGTLRAPLMRPLHGFPNLTAAASPAPEFISPRGTCHGSRRRMSPSRNVFLPKP